MNETQKMYKLYVNDKFVQQAEELDDLLEVVDELIYEEESKGKWKILKGKEVVETGDLEEDYSYDPFI